MKRINKIKAIKSFFIFCLLPFSLFAQNADEDTIFKKYQDKYASYFINYFNLNISDRITYINNNLDGGMGAIQADMMISDMINTVGCFKGRDFYLSGSTSGFIIVPDKERLNEVCNQCKLQINPPVFLEKEFTELDTVKRGLIPDIISYLYSYSANSVKNRIVFIEKYHSSIPIEYMRVMKADLDNLLGSSSPDFLVNNKFSAKKFKKSKKIWLRKIT